MTGFDLPDWSGMFVPDGSLVESFLRGTVVYFAIVILFRVVLKRQLGSLGLGDVLLLVLVSEAASQALTAETTSIPNGLAAVAALIVWNYVMDLAAYKWERVRRLLEPDPLPLVENGRPVREHLETERITPDELLAQLRMNGFDDVAKVRAAFIEGSGQVSVIPMPDGRAERADPEPPAGRPDFDGALEHFLTAARVLQRAAAWHDEQAAAHRRHAEQAKEALRVHGVRPRALLTPDPPAPVHTNGVHSLGSPEDRCRSCE